MDWSHSYQNEVHELCVYLSIRSMMHLSPEQRSQDSSLPEMKLGLGGEARRFYI